MNYLQEPGMYQIWAQMKSRCMNPRHKRYDRYGGRGITICDRWTNSFKNFYLDMGQRPRGFTLERIDNNKGYSPENCKWASRAEQNRNKTNNIIVNVLGRPTTVAEAIEVLGLSEHKIGVYVRLRSPNFTVENAFLKPFIPGKRAKC